MEYHKINSIFKRESEGKCNIIIGDYSTPEIEYLKGLEWQGTEKVDGTNIRIIWDGETVKFGGKTDNAQLHTKLLDTLYKLFPADKVYEVFGTKSIVLYGEGYGAPIQSKAGKRYAQDGTARFIMFDALSGGYYLQRESLEDIANKLSIELVPLVITGTLDECIDMVQKGFKSVIADDNTLIAEGLILTPKVQLFDRKGNRIITKIKYSDFEFLRK